MSVGKPMGLPFDTQLLGQLKHLLPGKDFATHIALTFQNII